MTMVELQCPACGGRTRHSERFRKNGFPIVACEQCGLGRTVVPAEFDPAPIYNNGYFDGGRAGQAYFDYVASEPVLRREFRHALRSLARIRPLQKGARLLELGAAYGFLLSEAQTEYGTEGTGLDVSSVAIEFARARGLAVYHVNDSSWERRGPFDAAVMLDTIEHLADPDTVLDTLQRVMRPDGSLLLTTGDWHSLYARLAGSHWRLMTPPEHLFFYTASTVRALLARHGFQVLDVTYPWKTVPLALALYQLTERVGVHLPRINALHRLGVTVNLFDAMRVIAVRRRA